MDDSAFSLRVSGGRLDELIFVLRTVSFTQTHLCTNNGEAGKKTAAISKATAAEVYRVETSLVTQTALRKQHRVTRRRRAEKKRLTVADSIWYTMELWLPLAVTLMESCSL